MCRLQRIKMTFVCMCEYTDRGMLMDEMELYIGRFIADIYLGQLSFHPSGIG